MRFVSDPSYLGNTADSSHPTLESCRMKDVGLTRAQGHVEVHIAGAQVGIILVF